MTTSGQKHTLDSLKLVLTSGYDLIEKRNLYQTPRIPRSWEKDFNPRDSNFYRAIRQQSINGDFFHWDKSLLKVFEVANLSWARFRRRTEDFDESTDNYSEAATFKRKVDELDRIVTSKKTYEAYLLPPGYPPVEFTQGELIQGIATHIFYEEQATILLNLLWDGRKILDPQGLTLKEAKPIEREEVLSAIKSTNDRFMTVVRNIHTMSHRKNISLKVKFPKGQSGALQISKLWCNKDLLHQSLDYFCVNSGLTFRKI